MAKIHTLLIVFTLLCHVGLVKAQVYYLSDLLQLRGTTLAEEIMESENAINEYDNILFYNQVLPKVQLSAVLPNVINSISPITMGDGSEKFVNRFYMTSMMSLGVSQLVPFTGGTLSFSSGLTRLDNYSPQRNKSYNYNLFNLSYYQNVSIFNQYKWDKRLLHKQNEVFGLDQIKSREKINLSIVELFFDLLEAQKKEELKIKMEENALLIYEKAKALYSQGRIAYSELLDAEIALNNYRNTTVHNERVRQQRFLVSKMKLAIDNPIVVFDFDSFDNMIFSFDIDIITHRAVKYSASIQQEFEQLLQERDVKRMKAAGLPSLSISIGGGYNSHNEEFRHLTKTPSSNFSAIISIGVPILSWGENRYQVNRLIAQNHISMIEYMEKVSDLEITCNYELDCLPLLLESIKASKATLHALYSQLQELTKQYEAGRISFTRIQDSQKEIIQTELNRIDYAKQLYYLKYKYRMIALFDVFENNPIDGEAYE